MSHDTQEGTVPHRCMTLPTEVKSQAEGDDKRSSTGEYSVPLVSPLNPGVSPMNGGTVLTMFICVSLKAV